MNWFKKKRIFLDYASTTPVLPEVRRIMNKFWSKNFYNSSTIYREGVLLKEQIEEDRTYIARSLGVASSGVIFTASGTEANNLAILGAFEAFRLRPAVAEQTQGKKSKNSKPHIIISAIEHPSVTETAKEVVRRGGEMDIIEVDNEGRVSPEILKGLLKENTFFVSIGLANGEIGTIQPLQKIGRLLREYRKEQDSVFPYIHTDASQALNYLDVSIEGLNVDLLTIDASKIYGPKGIGALIMSKGIKIHPIIFGGGQEFNLRSGTLNPALISGMALALKIAKRDQKKEFQRLDILRELFIQSIKKCLPSVIINESFYSHLPNIISVSVPGHLAEFILLKLDKVGVMVSVGSACSLDGKESGSSVIKAIGREALAEQTLRFSFGRGTTKNDVIQTVKKFCKIMNLC